MRHIRLFTIAGLAALAAGCATGKTPPPATGASMSLDGQAPVREIQFTGRFSPVSGMTSGAVVTGATRMTGTVKLTSINGADDLYRVEIDFTSDRGSEELMWSVVDGRCGSGGIPLLPPRQLRPIEVPSNGRGQLTTELRAPMAPGSTYHLNLYANGSSDLSAVVGCANLRN